MLSFLFVLGSAACAYSDAKRKVIPNVITFPLMLCGAVNACINRRLEESVLAFLFLTGIFFLGWLLGGIGGGDVKFVAGISLFFGQKSFLLVTVAAVSAALYSVFVLAKKGIIRRRGREAAARVKNLCLIGIKAFEVDGEKDESSVPFGLFLGGAVLFFYFLSFLK